MKATKRDAFTCGICGAQLQPLDQSTGWYTMATEQLASWDLEATPALLALTSHVSIVHDDEPNPPGFPPMERG